MDKRFQSRRSWVAVAAVGGVIFLCITLCFLGALGTMFLRNSSAVVPQVQPPEGGEGAAVPQVYYGHRGGHSGVGLLGLLGFGALMVFGLLLVLGIGRLVMRPWRCGPHTTGGEWKGHLHPWGPRRWHAGDEGPGEGDEPPGSQEPPDDSSAAYEGAA